MTDTCDTSLEKHEQLQTTRFKAVDQRIDDLKQYFKTISDHHEELVEKQFENNVIEMKAYRADVEAHFLRVNRFQERMDKTEGTFATIAQHNQLEEKLQIAARNLESRLQIEAKALDSKIIAEVKLIIERVAALEKALELRVRSLEKIAIIAITLLGVIEFAIRYLK